MSITRVKNGVVVEEVNGITRILDRNKLTDSKNSLSDSLVKITTQFTARMAQIDEDLAKIPADEDNG